MTTARDNPHTVRDNPPVVSDSSRAMRNLPG